MGIITGKNQGNEIYSTKWITAEITDISNRVHFVPIKNVIGDYFLTEINKQLYCFKIDGSRVKVWQQSLTKSFRILHYDINHYRPVSAKDITELDNILRANSLHKVDKRMLRIMKHLGRREKAEQDKPFTAHDLVLLQQELASQKSSNEFAEEAMNMIKYLENLDITQIVTPLRKLSEFLEQDLVESDPHFFGTVTNAFKAVETENKYMTNVPVTAKKSYIKLFIIIGLCFMVIGVGAFLLQSGMLNNLVPQIGGGNPQVHTATAVYQNYPTPEALKAAITRGEVNYNDLPNDIKHEVDQVKTPTATPTKP